MKKFMNFALKHIASLSLCVAVLAAGTASFWGGHQPEEPDLTSLKNTRR